MGNMQNHFFASKWNKICKKDKIRQQIFGNGKDKFKPGKGSYNEDQK